MNPFQPRNCLRLIGKLCSLLVLLLGLLAVSAVQAQTNSLVVGLGTDWNNIAGTTETNQVTLSVEFDE